DVARQWGARQSVARDYVSEHTVLIGSNRIGPDLRNVGGRGYADADFFYKLLYAPDTVAPGTNMPAYPFLFEMRKINPAQPSAKAVKVTGKHAAPAGYEIVPTSRADALVAYLSSLKDTYEYPEAKPFVEETKKEEAKPAKKEGGH
ncbi:MAG TPA: cbb3-type cytochrome c oxidase subunit II, partial [Candidatus Didemnitutus sp.]|nr:cbb3-type cytochrome c oxidase subunit II [Candidatus Didemnitutus sp.]